MKNIAGQILEGLDRFYKAFQRKRVLKSLEEVSATTNEEDIAAAVTVAELSNKLGEQPEWLKDATGKITGYRFGGADTVFPFNVGFKKAKITLRYTVTLSTTSDGNRTAPLTITCIINNNDGKLSISESRTYSSVNGVFSAQGFGVGISYNGGTIEILEQ